VTLPSSGESVANSIWANRLFVGAGVSGLFAVDLPLVQEFVPSSKRGWVGRIVTCCLPLGGPARWCLGAKVETAGGAFQVREYEPEPRVGARPHRTPNASPKPFVWTADPDAIIEKVRRGKQVLESIH
jgi:hypothetical protein